MKGTDTRNGFQLQCAFSLPVLWLFGQTWLSGHSTVHQGIHLLTIRTIEPLQDLHNNYSKMVSLSIPTHIKNPDALRLRATVCSLIIHELS